MTKGGCRLIDGIFYPVTQKKSRKKVKLWVFLLIGFILGNLAFFGQLSASYVMPTISLAKMFKSGKYLILLQNNSEIRSSGGFIGSFAVLETENYKIKNLEFNTNIYALDHEFAKDNHIEGPPPVAKMLKGESWALRDANYDASFPEAAKDVMQFYNWETGNEIDGVIALNAQVVVDLLRLVGPVRLDKYDLTVTADNFYRETQFQVEKAYYENPENWVINEPKTILKDMYPILLERAKNQKLDIYKLIRKELAEKEIVLYFSNTSRQAKIEEQNWAGKIPTEMELKSMFADKQADYLYINSNSYSGNKSSISINQEINYKISESVDSPGEMLEASLTISRVHAGTNDWPDGKNTEWMRIFTPVRSELLGATLNERDVSSKITTGTEFEKNYFGLEVVTEPGQANILELKYLIPKFENYQVLIQRQPGVENTNLQVNYLGNILFDGLLDRDLML